MTTTFASQALVKKSPMIMKRWEERARLEIASAFGTSSLSMRDALPGHLSQLVVALASVGEKSNAEIAITTTHEVGIGKKHGRDRASTSDYSIAEVIFEYRILRQVVVQVLEEEVALSGAEREIIADLIEQAVNDAAVEYSETVRSLRNQFTATLTHDLRGPLTAAGARAQMIVRQAAQPELCIKNAQHIQADLARMDAMIQNLLDACRIRAGQGLPAHLVECNPAQIARELMEGMAGEAGERFVLSTGPALVTWWDRDLFRRALQNLLSNAVKYGDPQTPITIQLRSDGDKLHVSVHNDGQPIAPAEQASLFQVYRRSKSAEQSLAKGWGLGLTLVAGVMTAHQGAVRVESSGRDGTTFVLTLPLDCRPERGKPS